LRDALAKYSAPTILHSDQGNKYLSHKHQLICEQYEITLSCSKRASPWQNGFMERFFGSFKPELGRLSQYRDLGELHEAIALTTHYYNTERIHTSLKMSPAAYAATLIPAKKRHESLDKVLQKVRA
jgi:putative transposase